MTEDLTSFCDRLFKHPKIREGFIQQTEWLKNVRGPKIPGNSGHYEMGHERESVFRVVIYSETSFIELPCGPKDVRKTVIEALTKLNLEIPEWLTK